MPDDGARSRRAAVALTALVLLAWLVAVSGVLGLVFDPDDESGAAVSAIHPG